MARHPRYAPPNYTHHIYTRGNNKQDIFLDDNDHEYYLELLQKNKQKYSVLIYHYALMKNHIHLMAMAQKEGVISKIMQCINTSYALYFRKKHGGFGHLWQGRFQNIPILQESYYFKCMSYIELNPVTAGLVKYPKDYKWTSYQFYAYGKKNDIVDTDPFYELFGQGETERRINYISFIDSSGGMSENLFSQNNIPLSPTMIK